MLQLKLFGDFSLSSKNAVLSAENCHSPRVLRALLYLLANRKRRVLLKDFSLFLREGKSYTAPASYSAGSDSLVKTTLFRIRALLSVFEEDEPACRLVCRDGGVWFDPALVITADTDRFDEIAAELLQSSDNFAKDSPKRERILFLLSTLFSLYQGKYLASLSPAEKLPPQALRYHQLYTELSEKYFSMLYETGDYRELAKKASEAAAIDLFFEGAHYYRMLAHLALGEIALAKALYQSVEKLLFESFRLNPSARLRRLKSEFTPSGANASKACAYLLSLNDAALSHESFGALLSYAKEQEKPFTFAFIRLKNAEKAEEAASFVAKEVKWVLRYGKESLALLFEKDEALSQRLKSVLVRIDPESLYEEEAF